MALARSDEDRTPGNCRVRGAGPERAGEKLERQGIEARECRMRKAATRTWTPRPEDKGRRRVRQAPTAAHRSRRSRISTKELRKLASRNLPLVAAASPFLPPPTLRLPCGPAGEG